ncbi:MAG TPA: Gfo/Idh/MocA family oxidoreductase [Gemmataceae bacterium]
MTLSRRDFLATTAALSAPLVLPAALRGQRTSANDRIGLGFIGVGTMGRGHLGAFLGMDDVQVVAVCDVVAERRENALKMVRDRYAERKKGEPTGCKEYSDFRKLLEQKDVDAVVIATPDHWHAIPCVRAAEAGKDIYCEKPLTHHIDEGKKIVEAVRRHKVVFQTGSQQRSEFGGRFRYAAELIRAGRIGKVKTVRIGVGGPAVPCDLPEQPVPEGTDWDLWLGPAPERGYNEVLCPKGVHRHFPAWRNYREYAGGGLADMGAHHFDIAQWALGMDGSGPVKVEPPEGKETRGLKFTYAGGVEMIHNVFEGERADCLFEGTDGTIAVSRGSFKITPEERIKEKDEIQMVNGNHRRNWVECVRTRQDPVCPAEVGHRSATICHLGNIGYWLRRPLQWDPQRQQYVGDDEANALLYREGRGEWKL